jgi:hypothetical protein
MNFKLNVGSSVNVGGNLTTTGQTILNGSLNVGGITTLVDNIFINPNKKLYLDSPNTTEYIYSTGTGQNVHHGSINGNFFFESPSGTILEINKTTSKFYSSSDVSGNMKIDGTAYMKGIIQDDISNNTYIGNCFSTRNGFGCIAIGNGALNMNTTATYAVAIGYKSCRVLTTGIDNVALGAETLFSAVGGNKNVAVGTQSLRNNVSGYCNTSVGCYAGYNTTWNNNTFLGFQAGYSNTSGGANSFLGSNTDISGGQYNYSTAIGFNTKITANNTIFLGRTF